MGACLTSVDYIVVMEVIYSLEDLSDCLGSIFLCEFPVFANTIEKLSTGR